MKPISRPRILVVEDKLSDRKEILELLGTMKLEGCIIEAPQGVGEELIQKACGIALDLRPQVAIVDLNLFDIRGDRSGLKLLEALRSAYCILYSAYLLPETTQDALRTYHAFSCIEKDDDPKKLLDAVHITLSALCASQKAIDLTYPMNLTAEDIAKKLSRTGNSVSWEVVEDLICALFPCGEVLRLEALGTARSSSVSPHPVSRGRSVVLKAGLKERLQPLIIKLAPCDNIEAEYTNYKDWIEGNLQGGFHAEIRYNEIFHRTPQIFWELGAIIYNFLGRMDQKPMSTLAGFYREEDNPNEILKPITHMFETVWGDLYKYKSGPMKEGNLFIAYDADWKLEKKIAGFTKKHDYLEFPSRGGKMTLPNPVVWADRNREQSGGLHARQAVTHGDLHGDNLFVSNGYSWAIDFERSKPGPILRDFVELEVDILTRLLRFKDDELFDLYELAVGLAAPDDPQAPVMATPRIVHNKPTKKALYVVFGLRQLAARLTHYVDFREYLWGLLLDCVFVACMTHPQSNQNRQALLYGAVIADRLQNWGGRWSPPDWPEIKQHLDAVDELTFHKTLPRRITY